MYVNKPSISSTEIFSACPFFSPYESASVCPSQPEGGDDNHSVWGQETLDFPSAGWSEVEVRMPEHSALPRAKREGLAMSPFMLHLPQFLSLTPASLLSGYWMKGNK